MVIRVRQSISWLEAQLTQKKPAWKYRIGDAFCSLECRNYVCIVCEIFFISFQHRHKYTVVNPNKYYRHKTAKLFPVVPSTHTHHTENVEMCGCLHSPHYVRYPTFVSCDSTFDFHVSTICSVEMWRDIKFLTSQFTSFRRQNFEDVRVHTSCPLFSFVLSSRGKKAQDNWSVRTNAAQPGRCTETT